MKIVERKEELETPTLRSSMKRAISSDTLRILNEAVDHEEKQRSSQLENYTTKLIKTYVNISLDVLILGLIIVNLYEPKQLMLWISYPPKLTIKSLTIKSIGLTSEDWGYAYLDEFIAWTLAFLLCLVLLVKTYWIGWFVYRVVRSIGLWCIVLYQLVRIVLSLCALALLRGHQVISSQMLNYSLALKDKKTLALRQRLSTAKTYKEWLATAIQVDQRERKVEWKNNLSLKDHFDFVSFRKNTERLVIALEKGEPDEIAFLLRGFLKRNKLGIDSPELHLRCLNGTKNIIELYNRKVIQSLNYLCHCDQFHGKLRFFLDLRRSFGYSALCLSGGGSIGMYHMGVIKALLEHNLLPTIISGSSGGSITAAMLACKTNQELLDDIIQDDISTRFKDINWFPPLLEQISHFIRTGFLMSNERFETTTKHYFGDPLNSLEKTMYFTFREAFEKTGRHVSITVSASDITGRKGPRKLLLNHINTPDVFLWSAVAVSCSLPGIMEAKKLYCRDTNGQVVPYVALGQEWIDGSVSHDLPFDSLSTCFNTTNFIVSQVNPHVVPFISKDIDSPRRRNDFVKTLESVISMDIRHRLRMLAKFGVVPKVYGQELGKMFKQKFCGHVTIVPSFNFEEAVGIKAILNPTVKDMNRYIQGGQSAVWPKISFIRHLCEIEKCLDQCLATLEKQGNETTYLNWLHPTQQQDYLKLHYPKDYPKHLN